MRWFAGWCPGSAGGSPPPPPADAKPLFTYVPGQTVRAAWTVGEWDWQARVVRVGRRQAAVLGACLATDAELDTALGRAERSGDLTLLTALPGSYVILLVDEHDMTVIPDLAGCWPLFFTPWEGGIAYSSSPLPLADLTGAGPDDRWLAAYLFAADIPHAATDHSTFTSIQRSRPGHLLTLGPRGVRQQPLALPLGGISAPKGARRLRRALLMAVRRRCARAPRLSADLSGGLDSSSLALLAAATRPGDRLPAVTYVDPVSGSADDLAYARMCAQVEPALKHIEIVGEPGMLPFTDLDGAPLLDEPAQDVLFHARDRVLLSVAEGGLHLTGDGGDSVLTGPLAYLADLARSGRAARLVREASAWARLRHRPAHAVIRAAVRMSRTNYPQAMAAAREALREGSLPPRRGVEDLLCWFAPSPAVTWAQPAVRAELADQLAAAMQDGDPALAASGDAAALRLVRGDGAASRPYAHLAASFGIDLHAPYLDNQVVAACAAVPVIERTTTAAAKPLLAAALDGLVPAQLLARRTKGAFTACMYAGLRQAAPDLHDLLHSPLLAEAGLIDAVRVRQALDLLLAGSIGPLASLGDVVAAEVWLHAIRRPRPALWTAHSPEVRHAVVR
ncbi:albusnodin/ikarugamycin family macrolactam cyclase [Sphaerisporangium sp. NPDC051017]|uniref:albusnodin/ikarugamycin family macrolactam cyclase n=1 Tax=Sphaerisporangium sp. NPDC051017 TaxID=3154636 RepID=UPI00342D834F